MISSITSLDWVLEDLDDAEVPEDSAETEPAVIKTRSSDELEDVLPALLTL